jgi:hypothetical protein
MEKEIWKIHPEFKSYEFSNLGRYKKDGILKELKQNNLDGYIKITNANNKKRTQLHRIIAELFCDGRTDEKKIVDHINGLRDDNRSVNLRWATYSENNLNRRDDGVISTKCLKKDYSTDKGYVKFLEEQLERLNKDVQFWSNEYFKMCDTTNKILKLNCKNYEP